MKVNSGKLIEIFLLIICIICVRSFEHDNATYDSVDELIRRFERDLRDSATIGFDSSGLMTRKNK